VRRWPSKKVNKKSTPKLRGRNTSAVSVENNMLLVPLSKMIVRLVFRSEVVFPLTESWGDVSCHVPPDAAGRDAYLRLSNTRQ
jgi:hypothetical protein